jgi:hypothetical protein
LDEPCFLNSFPIFRIASFVVAWNATVEITAYEGFPAGTSSYVWLSHSSLIARACEISKPVCGLRLLVEVRPHLAVKHVAVRKPNRRTADIAGIPVPKELHRLRFDVLKADIRHVGQFRGQNALSRERDDFPECRFDPSLWKCGKY